MGDDIHSRQIVDKNTNRSFGNNAYRLAETVAPAGRCQHRNAKTLRRGSASGRVIFL